MDEMETEKEADYVAAEELDHTRSDSDYQAGLLETRLYASPCWILWQSLEERLPRYGILSIYQDTIRYDTIYLRVLKNWWYGQLSLAHGTETTN